MKKYKIKEFDRNKSSLHILISIIWHRWILNQSLKVDVIAKPKILGGDLQKYYRREYWTNEPISEIRLKNYKKAIKWYDSIYWAGVPVWLKISNLEQFDIHKKDNQDMFIYSQDTSATLNDVMTSNATSVFIKQMAKIAMSKMDIQTMLLMAIIGVGAVVGLHYLGIF